MSVVFPSAIAEFLRRPIVAAVITLNTDSSPRVTYAWCLFDGQQLRVTTSEGRLKTRNVRRNPRMAVSILDPENPIRYLSVRGRATVTDQGARDLVREAAIHQMGPETGEAMAQQLLAHNVSPVVLTLEPEHLYANGF